jgi:hypothetical protein
VGVYIEFEIEYNDDKDWELMVSSEDENGVLISSKEVRVEGFLWDLLVDLWDEFNLSLPKSSSSLSSL